MHTGLIPRFVTILVAGGMTESLLTTSWSRATIPVITGCYDDATSILGFSSTCRHPLEATGIVGKRWRGAATQLETQPNCNPRGHLRPCRFFSLKQVLLSIEYLDISLAMSY